MFACFAFVLSQTYDGFYRNVCMFHLHLYCQKLWFVLAKCSHVLHLCYRQRNLCSVETFAHFAFVSSQLYCGFCLNVVCFVFVLSQTYLRFCLNVCVFYICVVTNLPCVLFNSFYNFHLRCHKRLVCSV